MAAVRSAATKIDWTRISTQLGLRGNTAAQLQAFKKRNDDARRRLQVLGDQPQDVDFAHYRGILKNSSIIDELEKEVKGFKPKAYDVARQIKAIETFEVQAIKGAEQTAKSVESELKDLSATLANIESARPFDECTVDDIKAAEPEIEKKVENHVKNHRWMPAGYKEKFGDLSVL